MAEVSEANSQRSLYANGFEVNRLKKFPSNYVTTTKYNIVTFLPFSLLEQFKRLPNVYFLIIAILQSLPQISALGPYTAIAPICFVLAVSIIRDGFEDYLRYKADKETNSTKTQIYRKGTFEEKTFKDIEIGNIIMVKKDEAFPCDIVMLSNSSDNGIAYIETSSLDGEKALKPRLALQATMNIIKKDQIIRVFSLIECDHPNAKIYEFKGTMEYNYQKHPLTKDNLLLAGAFLRNTEWVIGVAVYTGTETKLRMNLMKRIFKQSQVERIVNKYIVGILAIQFSLCFVHAILSGIWSSKYGDDSYYLDGNTYSPGLQGFLTYFTYFLLLNTMLPISLIVSLEILKLMQGFFMQQDLRMYSSIRDRPCKVSAFSLNEELGMIQHIFSDKTGTLTRNRMEFKFCSVGNKMYGEKKFLLSRHFSSVASKTTKAVIFTFDTKEIENDLFSHEETIPLKYSISCDQSDGKETISTQQELLDLFVKCMSLCHECLIEEKENETNYIGQSPDEIVLVDCAARVGYKYAKVRGNIIDLHKTPFGVNDQVEIMQFDKLCTLEFNSDRKRCSVIVTDKQTGKHILFTKGADTKMIKLLSSENPSKYIDNIMSNLLTFSERGYRTLVFAFKYIDDEYFKDWKSRYDIACTLINGREEMVSKLSDEIETDLYLLGCTAVEDALQDDVPSTIQDLLAAGINIWMLTGDKFETAENIGKTCSLVDENMEVGRCPAMPLDDCLRTLESISEKFHEVGDQKPTALVIEGSCLEFVLFDANDPAMMKKEPELANNPTVTAVRKVFLEMAVDCKTVICCRVTPGQKRGIVKLMKDQTGSVTLSVGDGANDVSMILEAHIGVGIYGEEGMQAVQASDYAVGEFRYLWELLLIHGRFNYIRQSHMIMYFFYKNLVFTIPNFFYGFYCAYSGETVYDDWYITFYNMVFTAVPLMARALFEVDILIPKRYEVGANPPGPKDTLRKLIPKAYNVGRLNQIFTARNFWGWLLNGILHSVIVFFIPLYAAEEGIMNKKGYNYDHWGFSIMSFTSIILIVNLKLGLNTKYWNWVHYLAIGITSILAYLLFIVIYDPFTSTPSNMTLYQMFATQYFYIGIITTTLFVVVLDGGYQLARRIFKPSSSEMMMDYSLKIYKNEKKSDDDI
ncbi:unnamed protein product [Blepharisma stoltei]|uniref:Phospholipid-transporting ATPase n=1 Tax=Blepharisma stoltei TaxID=1481888 RepID=A0AAU9JIF0_9CILI|nr:unnamed protein product [Blepharisma stoltei]